MIVPRVGEGGSRLAFWLYLLLILGDLGVLDLPWNLAVGEN